MLATKIVVTITIEVLDLASAPVLIESAAALMRTETDHGIISKTDGDKITWETKRTEVSF